MKKILISLAIIGVVAAIGVGATVAYFSDTETSTGNTFTAGTLDLNLDGANINVVKFTVGDVKPGDSGTGYWTLKNVGSLLGYVDVKSISVVDEDVTCTEPEGIAEADVNCGGTGAGTGELGSKMNVTLFTDVDHDGTVDAGDGDVVVYTGKLNAIAGNYDQNISLAAGLTTYVSLNWSIDGATVGNEIQSDKTTLGMTFELGQNI